MKIAFFGTAEFSASILRDLLWYEEVEVVFVVSQEDKCIWRKREIQKTAVKLLAEKKWIPVFQPKNLRHDGSLEAASQGIDFYVVVAYGKIIPLEILEIPAYASINLHGSLLPKYRWASPVQESIKKWDTMTWLTTMLMSEGMDEWDMLLTKKIAIWNKEKQIDVFKKFEAIGGQLILDTLKKFTSGSLKGLPQVDSQATYCGKIQKCDGCVSFTKMSVATIFNHYRAYTPWPGIHTYFLWKKIDIIECENIDLYSTVSPGMLIEFEKKQFWIVCSDQKILKIKNLKLEWKKTMDILTFINGNKDFIWYIFE